MIAQTTCRASLRRFAARSRDSSGHAREQAAETGQHAQSEPARKNAADAAGNLDQQVAKPRMPVSRDQLDELQPDCDAGDEEQDGADPPRMEGCEQESQQQNAAKRSK